jgi:L-ascorbate metabolism protein UlaG (beta-lactamase superfamily)
MGETPMPLNMIPAIRKNDDFLADVQAARREPDKLHLWWLGQSGFLLQWQGRHVLIDPYLSDSLTAKYANTEKPHERMTERVIDPARLDFIDVVTSSHHHTDHLDADTLKPLLRASPDVAIVVPEASRDFSAERLGVDPSRLIGADAGKTVSAGGFTFTGIPAAHEKLVVDEHGRCKFLGYLVQLGPHSVYHSGDTVWHDAIVDALRGRGCDVAILPINGAVPARKVDGNLNGHEAARLARVIGAGVAIPCHYDMFAFNTDTPDAFVAECERTGQPFNVMRSGQRISL